MKHSPLKNLLTWLLPGVLQLGIVEDGGGGAGGSGEGTQGSQGSDPASGKGKDGNPDDGRKISDEEAKLLKEVMQKKEALQRTQSELAATQDKLKQFDGIDPAAIKKLLAEQKAAEEAQLEAKGEFDRLKQRMAEEHANETRALQEQISRLTSQLGSANADADALSIGVQFAQSPFIANELTMTAAKARVVYGAHFDRVEGKVVAYDKPRGEANRTALVDQYGTALAFDAALRKLVELDPDRDHLLKSKVKPGAGSESKKPQGHGAPAPVRDSLGKIGAGLKGLNLLAQVDP